MKTVSPEIAFEECGILAVYGHPEAARVAYLGLCAMQHRGQGSAGICASDGKRLVCCKSRGLAAEIFVERVLNELSGRMAIGHVGHSSISTYSQQEAQPYIWGSSKGQLAMTCNGNVTNAGVFRHALWNAQTTNESDVLPARSQKHKLAAFNKALLSAQPEGQPDGNRLTST